MRQRLFICFLAIIIILIGTSCMRSQSKGVTSSEFIPPTLVATVFKTPTTDPFRPTEDPRGPCDDNLEFVDDLTVPDGTVFAPGGEIDKKWQIKNSGTCEWISKYSIRMLSGDSMGAESKQKLQLLQPGETGEVEITFIAPDEPGSYYSQWQAYDAQGKPFGQDFYLDIVVAVENTGE
ncbi:MAG: NBR1-Ig-like domain-containing protein [Flexilinea sp.]